MHSVKMVGQYTIRGRGIVYGGKDLQGDTFTAETDLGETRSLVGLPVYYDHALGSLRGQIGTVKAWIPDDDGIDVEIELDKNGKYIQQVMELVKKGKMGLSTGALSHLVERKSGELKRWIVGEISLTPTPAEPRTFAMVKTAGHQGQPETGDSGCDGMQSDIDSTNNRGDKMADTTLRDQVISILADVAGEPVKGGGVITNRAPAAKKLTTLGTKSEPTEALMHWIKTDDTIAAKATLVEGTGANGGFLVPRDFATQIVDKRDESWIGAKLGVQRYTTDRQIFDIADQNEKADFAFVAESGSANFDEPTFSQSAIQVYTSSLAMKISNQLLRDQAMDLEGFLTREIGRAYARHLNQYMITGTGSSQPYGVLARATVFETLTTVAGISAANVINIAHKLPSWYSDDSGAVGWVMQNSTLGAIRSLATNFFAFQPTPMGGMDSLYGKPYAISDKISALGASNKCIIYGNWNYYAFVENLGLEISRNPYLYQANYQTALFTTIRWGGDVTQSEAFVYGINPAS